MTKTGIGKCGCGKTISANKLTCGTCATNPRPAPTGCLEILNCQAGDTKLTFDTGNVSDTIRAKRIVTDMLRRGYALVVEIERDGKKAYERVQAFDEVKGEYLIIDLDPLVAQKTDEQECPEKQPPTEPLGDSDQTRCHCGRPLHHRGSHSGPRNKYQRLPMESTKATGIGRSAGG